jgi:hypothetical protein
MIAKAEDLSAAKSKSFSRPTVLKMPLVGKATLHRTSLRPRLDSKSCNMIRLEMLEDVIISTKEKSIITLDSLLLQTVSLIFASSSRNCGSLGKTTRRTPSDIFCILISAL